MNVYSGLKLHIVGAWKFGISDYDISCSIVIIVPKDRVNDILEMWRAADIKSYDKPYRYVIRGNGFIPDAPKAPMYNITIIPKDIGVSDRHFILSNPPVQKIIDDYTVRDEYVEELHDRLRIVVDWTRSHGLYGGKFPDSDGYLVYCMNTIDNGYGKDMVIPSLHRKTMYIHPVSGSMYVSHVPEISYSHIRSVIQDERYQTPRNIPHIGVGLSTAAY